MLKFGKQAHDFDRKLRIEIAGRFRPLSATLGLGDDGAGDAHNAGCSPVESEAEADVRSRASRPFSSAARTRRPRSSGGNAPDDQRQLNVRKNGAIHQQTMILEHHAKGSAQLGNAALTDLRQAVPIEADVPMRRAFDQRSNLSSVLLPAPE